MSNWKNDVLDENFWTDVLHCGILMWSCNTHPAGSSTCPRRLACGWAAAALWHLVLHHCNHHWTEHRFWYHCGHILWAQGGEGECRATNLDMQYLHYDKENWEGECVCVGGGGGEKLKQYGFYYILRGQIKAMRHAVTFSTGWTSSTCMLQHLDRIHFAIFPAYFLDTV